MHYPICKHLLMVLKCVCMGLSCDVCTRGVVVLGSSDVIGCAPCRTTTLCVCWRPARPWVVQRQCALIKLVGATTYIVNCTTAAVMTARAGAQ